MIHNSVVERVQFHVQACDVGLEGDDLGQVGGVVLLVV